MGERPDRLNRVESALARERILVTGAGGFIGANLVRRLLAVGAEVWCLTRPAPLSWRLREVAKDIRPLPIGLRRFSALRSVLREVRPAVIYHLAAYGNSSYHRSAARMIAVNILGTENLLRASSDAGCRIFIHTGSSSEYGFHDLSVSENALPEPMSRYAVCKLAATGLCRFYAGMEGRPALTLRLFSVYGPFEDPRRFVPTAIRAAFGGHPLPLTGGDEAHDFVHVDDVVEALLLAAGLQNPGGAVINICGGRQWTNLEVVRAVERAVGKKIDLRVGEYPSRSWDSAAWMGERKLAEKLLKWKPRIRLAAGLKSTADWMRTRRDLCQPGGES